MNVVSPIIATIAIATNNGDDIVVNSICQPLLVCFHGKTAESRDEDTRLLLLKVPGILQHIV